MKPYIRCSFSFWRKIWKTVFLVFRKVGIYIFRAKNDIGRNLKENLKSVLKNDFKSSGEISLFATTGRNFDLLRFVLFHVRSTTLKLCKIMEIYVGGGAV